MTNIATARRDLSIARHLEDGTFAAWADGFGVWHARVPKTMGAPYNAARYTVRLMLQERAPRGAWIDPPSITRDPANDTDTGYAYVEAPIK
jgi:hypothetical protein